MKKEGEEPVDRKLQECLCVWFVWVLSSCAANRTQVLGLIRQALYHLSHTTGHYVFFFINLRPSLHLLSRTHRAHSSVQPQELN
jgi:hypothetical protein